MTIVVWRRTVMFIFFRYCTSSNPRTFSLLYMCLNSVHTVSLAVLWGLFSNSLGSGVNLLPELESKMCSFWRHWMWSWYVIWWWKRERQNMVCSKCALLYCIIWSKCNYMYRVFQNENNILDIYHTILKSLRFLLLYCTQSNNNGDHTCIKQLCKIKAIYMEQTAT